MSEITKPIALDESLHTTEQTPRNLADVLSDELQNLATAISGGSDKAPKTDIATVESTNTASRAYSVGELVYVNGNLYKVITAIASGATFTVGTNIQSTNVSGTLNKSFKKLQSNSQFVNIPSEAKEFICYVKNSKSANPQYIGYFNVEVLDMAQLNTVWFSDQFFYTYNKPSFTVTIRQSGVNYDAEYMIIYWR